MFMIKSIVKFFSKGHERSLNVKKNIFSSLLIKGGSILISLMLVPLTISFVNETQYGLWLTLSSIVGWFNFFDVGLGNGLKTKLTESISEKDFLKAKKYVSTTYAALALISLVLLIVFLIAQHFLDWSRILNAPSEYSDELWLVALVVFISFSFQFVLQLITVIAVSNQNTVIGSLINFIGNLISFIAIFFLTKSYSSGTLLQLCIPICLSPMLVLMLFSAVLYKTKYKLIAPSFKYVDFRSINEILSLGLKFFVIQLGLILYYNIDNMVITQVLGPKEVTPYNIAYKYFGVITMISAIVMTPLWAAYSEANTKGDYDWIRKTVKNLNWLCLGLAVLAVIMALISPLIYKFWVGEKIYIPLSLSLVLAFYTVWNTYRTIYIYYLNGIGVIKIQVYLVLISGILNIPLAIYLAKLFGVTGVVLSTTILCFFCGIIEIIQYKKLINNSATGLWKK
ncbi:oligosaccharide flippase family protein [Pedobacter sp. N36a]|uniref:lipopolysaccharide biosynthesis protein n=1 Tax=Pedobacter sp. N36a TaxID=2767996 RepID=UPI00165693DD|nr:MATE family efflux transporter [Pedobacter sp. N36a]MBC8986178.1 oligosaccharide flippase family protein [Pedobacter sp. N36a]